MRNHAKSQPPTQRTRKQNHSNIYTTNVPLRYSSLPLCFPIAKVTHRCIPSNRVDVKSKNIHSFIFRSLLNVTNSLFQLTCGGHLDAVDKPKSTTKFQKHTYTQLAIVVGEKAQLNHPPTHTHRFPTPQTPTKSRQLNIPFIQNIEHETI